MQNSETTTSLPTQAEYLLEIVSQEITDLKVTRDELDTQFMATGDWHARDENHGSIMALSKLKGRLEAMVQIQSYGSNPIWRS